MSISVSYDATACSAASPLRAIISNRADKALNSISWSMAAYVRGRSSNIVKYTSLWTHKSDHILEPNQMITLCYKAPVLVEAEEPSTLRWEAKDRLISFRY